MTGPKRGAIRLLLAVSLDIAVPWRSIKQTLQRGMSMSQSPRPVRVSLRAGVLIRAVLLATAGVLAAACADSPIPVAPARSVSLGKAPAGPAVSSASPAYSHRDTTLNVRVLGSGFATGATAEWALGGVTNPAKIRTNSTQFVSSSELVANITVSADADLALWDVVVTLLGGKRGVGTEMFEVTTATIIGGGMGGYVGGTSDQVSVAGYGDLSGAWLYDAISGATVDLGPGQGWGIDPTGTTAFGRDGNSAAAVWNRGLNGSWTKELLPNPYPKGNASSVAVAPDGSLLLGGWINIPTKRNENYVAPVVWRRVAGVWQSPQVYAMPSVSAAIYAISPAGVAAGRGQIADGVYRVFVWDNPTTYSTLTGGTAFGVDPSGTVAVGELAGSGAVYWYRTTAGSWTTTGTTLPSLGTSCTGGRGADINAAGIIVGYSCLTSGRNLATVWRLDLSGGTPALVGPPTSLGGLGPGASNTIGVAITSSAPYVVVGYVDAGTNITVRWTLP